MSIDRLLSVNRIKWKNVFKSKQAAAVSLGCFAIIMLINSNVLILFGSELNINGTVTIMCFTGINDSATWMDTWYKVSLIMTNDKNSTHFLNYVVL